MSQPASFPPVMRRHFDEDELPETDADFEILRQRVARRRRIVAEMATELLTDGSNLDQVVDLQRMTARLAGDTAILEAAIETGLFR